jgi:hypothetical protein
MIYEALIYTLGLITIIQNIDISTFYVIIYMKGRLKKNRIMTQGLDASYVKGRLKKNKIMRGGALESPATHVCSEYNGSHSQNFKHYEWDVEHEAGTCPADYEYVWWKNGNFLTGQVALADCIKNKWSNDIKWRGSEQRKEELKAANLNPDDNVAMCCLGEYNTIYECPYNWQYTSTVNPQTPEEKCSIFTMDYAQPFGKNECPSKLADACNGELFDNNFACNDYCKKNPEKCKHLTEYCNSDGGKRIDDPNSICGELTNNLINKISKGTFVPLQDQSLVDVLKPSIKIYCDENKLENNELCQKIAQETDLIDDQMVAYCIKEDNFRTSKACKKYCSHTKTSTKNRDKMNICDNIIGVPDKCNKFNKKIMENPDYKDKNFDEGDGGFCSCFRDINQFEQYADYPDGAVVNGLTPCIVDQCRTKGYISNNIEDSNKSCPECIISNNIISEGRSIVEINNESQICNIKIANNPNASLEDRARARELSITNINGTVTACTNEDVGKSGSLCSEFCKDPKNANKCKKLLEGMCGENLMDNDTLCNNDGEGFCGQYPDLCGNALNKYCTKDRIETDKLCKKAIFNSEVLDRFVDDYCDGDTTKEICKKYDKTSSYNPNGDPETEQETEQETEPDAENSDKSTQSKTLTYVIILLIIIFLILVVCLASTVFGIIII